MNNLPFETKLVTFDFKGTTLEIQIIAKCDNCLPKKKIWEISMDKI